jgi:hypothetical protein
MFVSKKLSHLIQKDRPFVARYSQDGNDGLVFKTLMKGQHSQTSYIHMYSVLSSISLNFTTIKDYINALTSFPSTRVS